MQMLRRLFYQSRLGRKISGVYAILATTLRKHFNASDQRRWSKISSLSKDWDERTVTIARMIPSGTSVLEFGAGRLVLKMHLPAGCRYTPSDICDRGEGTIVCDLNQRPLPFFPQHDLIVFSGVLEYIHNVPEVMTHLRGCCDSILASYVCATDKGKLEILQRRRAAWVNDYTAAELIAAFEQTGFACVEDVPWRSNQRIFRFQKKG
jgi:hypothetical protein